VEFGMDTDHTHMYKFIWNTVKKLTITNMVMVQKLHTWQWCKTLRLRI